MTTRVSVAGSAGRIITRADLENLPAPSSVREFPYADVLADYVAFVQAHDPTWSADPDSLLYKALEVMAYITVINRERRNEYDRRGDVTRSTGTDLDREGAAENLPRVPGEADADYRVRVINSKSARTSTATPAGLREEAESFQTDLWSIYDADIELQPVNSPDWLLIHIAAIKLQLDDEGNPVISDLTEDERAVYQEHMRGDFVQPIGYDFTVVATTAVAYTVAANLRVYEDVRAYDDVAADVQQAAIDFAREYNRVSHGLDVPALQAAMGCVAGVRSLVVTAPAASVPEVFGTHHVGPAMPSQVVLTRVPP